MINYEQAVAQADSGKGMHASTAGGRTRKAVFTLQDDGTVTVRLFQTIIAEYRPDGVTLRTGGYNTATTVDALNALTGPITFGTYKNVLYLHPYASAAERVPFTEGMRLDYQGGVIEHGTEQPPARPGRQVRA